MYVCTFNKKIHFPTLICMEVQTFCVRRGSTRMSGCLFIFKYLHESKEKFYNTTCLSRNTMPDFKTKFRYNKKWVSLGKLSTNKYVRMNVCTYFYYIHALVYTTGHTLNFKHCLVSVLLFLLLLGSSA